MNALLDSAQLQYALYFAHRPTETTHEAAPR
jgi:hypothetical protein